MTSATGKRTKAIICVIAALLLTACALFIGVRQLESNARRGVVERLVDSSEGAGQHVRMHFRGLLHAAGSMADTLAQSDDLTGEASLKLLGAAAVDIHAYDMIVTRADGGFASLSGSVGSVECADELMRVDAGVISDVFMNEQTGALSVCVTAPIVQNGSTAGALSVLYDVNALAESVAMPIFGGQGYFHVFQPDGAYVLRAQQAARLVDDKSFYSIRDARFAEGYGYDQLSADIAAGRSGVVEYAASDGMHMTGYYTSLGINNWYMICLVPDQAWTRFAEENVYVLILSVLAVLLVLAALGAALMSMSARELRELSVRETALDALAARQSAALSNLGAPAFEFDAHAMVARPLDVDDRTNTWLMERILTFDHASEVVAPCDEAAYLKFCDAILTAQGSMTGDFRMRLGPGEPVRMYRVMLSIPEYARDRSDMIVTLVDLDDVARHMEELRLRASFDELSGLDTFSEFRIKARALLNRPTRHVGALAFIRADNADAALDSAPDVPRSTVIRQCGEFMMEAMRDCDVFARGVGFEFWVFSGDQTASEIIQKGMNRLFDSQLGAGDVKLTFSCGISRADPDDGIDDLIDRARAAAQIAHRDGGHRLQHG